MGYIAVILKWITSLNAAVFVGIVMAVVCLAFRGGIKNAVRSGLLFSIGITGINMVMNTCISTVTPVATVISERLGTNLSIVDGGYGAMAARWSFPGYFIALTLAIGINVVMILLKWTKTMFTDIHNSWHGIFIGALIWAVTDNILFGIIVGLFMVVLGVKLGDLHAKKFQEFNGTPGIACYATSATFPGTFAWLIMKVIDKIPGLRSARASAEDIKDTFGLFGEPMVIGFIIGVILAAIARYPIDKMLLVGVTMAATLALFPKMAGLICEGIVPVTTTIMTFMKKHFGDRELNIAVDPAILLGDPSVMATFIIMVPISIIISFVVPGIGFIPIASLSAMPYWLGGVVPHTRGNVIHSVIVMTLFIGIAGVIATQLAPSITRLNFIGGYYAEQISAGAMLTCWDEGSNIFGLIFVKLFEALGLSVI